MRMHGFIVARPMCVCVYLGACVTECVYISVCTLIASDDKLYIGSRQNAQRALYLYYPPPHPISMSPASHSPCSTHTHTHAYTL